MNPTSSTHEIPAEIRQGIVRQLGAALATAWRQQAQKNESPEPRGDTAEPGTEANAAGKGRTHEHISTSPK